METNVYSNLHIIGFPIDPSLQKFNLETRKLANEIIEHVSANYLEYV